MVTILKVIGLVACVLGLHMFSSHAQPTNPTTLVYLFSTFKEGDQDGLRYAFSYDGYHWSNVPGLFLKAVGEKPIMRGPDGTWHLRTLCAFVLDGAEFRPSGLSLNATVGFA